MATSLVGGPKWMEGGMDGDFHRTYTLEVEVEGDLNDGPANVLQTPGLFLPGAFWLVRNDIDIWAWCRPDKQVTPVVRDAPNRYWRVSQLFSTKPPGRGSASGGPGAGGFGGASPGGSKDSSSRKRCGDIRIEDPLMEPPRISGSFTAVQKEATHDRFGNRLVNSAFQQLRGSQVEFEDCQDVVNVELTTPTLYLPDLRALNNTVNGEPLWGFPARCIRCRVKGWDRKFHGICFFYFTIQLEFHVNTVVDPDTGEVTSGWDRDLLDEGTKALNGHWNGRTWKFDDIYDDLLGNLGPPNMNYQSDYNEILDKAGTASTAILNGFGFPYNPDDESRSFHWAYSVGGVENTTSGTYTSVLTTVGSGNPNNIPEDAFIAGPFHSAAQATAALGFLEEPYYVNVIGHGFPVPGKIHVEYYPSADFPAFGIPVNLE